MISPPDNRRDSRFRTYDRMESAVFLRTTEEFGGLSNMAGGFPLQVNAVRILTSEALYQACRFPHMPEVQRLIIAQASPMTAKMKSKPYRRESRPDWNQVRVKIMRWCLRVKLAQNWTRFSELLLSTGSRPIVEASRKDDFWGANPVDDRTLVGINVLGRLLMELREEVRSGALAAPMHVDPLSIPEFLLDGHPIQPVIGRGESDYRKSVQRPERRVIASPPRVIAKQISMVYPAQSSAIPESQAIGKASLKPYPSYKASSAPLLGDIPAHWEVRSLGSLTSSVSQRRGSDLPLLSVVREKGVIPRSSMRDDENHNFIPDDLSNYKVVRAGSLVINKMKAWQGSLGIAPIAGIVSPAYYVFDFSIDDRHFGQALLRSRLYVELFARASDGVRIGQWDLSLQGMKRIPVVIPPPAEQTAIVRFLNHADRRIQRYIRAKKKLIALLNEQKQAIIHRAVTRGLYPAVRLKPSGVEWLGEVPEHWEVMALRLRYRQSLGKMLDSKRITGLLLLPYLRNTDVQWGRINTTDLPAMDVSPGEYERYTVTPGDLLVCEGGEVGRCAIWIGDLTICAFQKALHRLRPLSNDRDTARFLFYVFRLATDRDAFSDGHESTIAHLTGEKLRAHRFPFPPRAEQEAIVAHIKEATSSIEDAEGAALREIALLAEYRTRLIADVVTGKLDVREAAAKLPEELEEPEPLDMTEADDEEDVEGLDAEAGAEEATE